MSFIHTQRRQKDGKKEDYERIYIRVGVELFCRTIPETFALVIVVIAINNRMVAII